MRAGMLMMSGLTLSSMIRECKRVRIEWKERHRLVTSTEAFWYRS